MSTVYKDICATVVGEELPCQREDGNRAHPFAAIIGHIPKKIPSTLSTPGRLDCLSNNRIRTLLWGFSAMGT